MSETPALTPEDAEDPEAGEPVAELRGLVLPVGDHFAGRVGRRIERRALTNEFVEFAWAVPVAVVLELVLIPGRMLRGRRPSTDSRS
ncbi:MAG: hypothetical protein IT353_03985 [Gemmatimonadaceae bacterium]|nr:hypothetical protein [Gemmatimonadaceae bacterium]